MSVDTESGAAERAEQAAEWLVKKAEPMDAEQHRAFAEWLNEDPRNAEEYIRVSQAHRALARMLAAGREVARTGVQDRSVRPPPMAPPRDPRRRAWVSGALAAAAVIAVVAVGLRIALRIGIPSQAPPTAVLRFETPHGGRSKEILADSSIIHLNTDTALAVSYGRRERRVNLVRGEALFEVAHDQSRPFRVSAGSAEVTAVGTKFDVYLQSDRTRVIVLEGRVSVAVPSVQGSAPGTAEPSARQLIYLDAGQEVDVRDGMLPPGSTAVDAEREVSWRDGRISFDLEPLARVAGEFNRYGKKPIRIESSRLQDLRISGVFASDDTESFVAFLRSLPGVRVEEAPEVILVRDAKTR